jgi:hypothetical protein
MVFTPFGFRNPVRVHKARAVPKDQRKKAPKGNSESPWSLRYGNFWKIQPINPPEVLKEG